MKGCFYWGHHVLRLGYVAVIDCDDGDAGFEIGFDGCAGFITSLPTAAVDVEQERRWLVGLGFPKVENVALVRAVFEVFDRGRNGGFSRGLRCWFGGLVGFCCWGLRCCVLCICAEGQAGRE